MARSVPLSGPEVRAMLLGERAPAGTPAPVMEGEKTSGYSPSYGRCEKCGYHGPCLNSVRVAPRKFELWCCPCAEEST